MQSSMKNELQRHALVSYILRASTVGPIQCAEAWCRKPAVFRSQWCSQHKRWYDTQRAWYRTVEFDAWRSAYDRCHNPKHQMYKYYGGRGIEVCDGLTWFHWFLKILGPRPEGRTLDRIDNDGNYSCGQCPHCRHNEWPLNVRWATWKQQANNRRQSKSTTT